MRLIRLQCNEISKLKAQVRLWKKILQSENDKGRSGIKKVLSKCFTRGQSNGLKTGQLKGRWDTADMQMALRLRSASQEAYKFLRTERRLPLPAISTLTSWARRTVCEPGVQQNVLTFIRNRIGLRELSARDRCGVLCTNEMSIRSAIVQ